eukprot:GHVN01069423.1.p1 GENE.GHVN01069423.1~~GHVN01069423.1.p1  ORF type:complete len:180 (-),score=9.15 GHVN01069423.1:115-654(-)
MKSVAVVVLTLLSGSEAKRKHDKYHQDNYSKHTGPVSAPTNNLHEEQRRLTCPSGFQLEGKTCTSTSYSAPQDVCPHSAQHENGSCFVYAPLAHHCPPGFSGNGKHCTKSVVTHASLACQYGASLVGNRCEKVTPLAPHCPSGWSLNANTCEQWSPAFARCPDGFQAYVLMDISKTTNA